MTQANESLNLTASQHIERIYEHAHGPIFDYALVNTAPVRRALLDRYAGEGASPIVADIEAIEALGVRCIAGDFAAEGDVVRHAADRVADAVLRLGVKGARRNPKPSRESETPYLVTTRDMGHPDLWVGLSLDARFFPLPIPRPTE